MYSKIKYSYSQGSDPYSIATDPDPYPDPAFRLNTNPDPGMYDQKLKKMYSLKKKKKFFGSKTSLYLSLGLHQERPSYKKAFSSQKRTSITSKHEIS
jgi:hypothetical protein